MSYDARKWNANTRAPLPRRPLTRWLLLAGFVAGLLMALAATFAEAPSGGSGWFPEPTGIITIMVAASVSPFARESWFTARGRATFDDFEREALLVATTRAYAIFLTAAAAFLAWLWAGSAFGWQLPDTPRAWGSWFLLALMAGIALPATVAEFTVPFPPADDDA